METREKMFGMSHLVQSRLEYHTWSYVQSWGTVKSLLRGGALEEMKQNSTLLPKVLRLLSCSQQWGQEEEARSQLPASRTDRPSATLL